jgi:hypothetical protein
VVYLFKARTVKPAEAAIAGNGFANKHVSKATIRYNNNGSVFCAVLAEW